MKISLENPANHIVEKEKLFLEDKRRGCGQTSVVKTEIGPVRKLTENVVKIQFTSLKHEGM